MDLRIFWLWHINALFDRVLELEPAEVNW